MLLERVADLHGAVLQAGADSFHEILADGFFDDDNGGLEAGLVGIEQGVVQNGFALAAYGIDLL